MRLRRNDQVTPLKDHSGCNCHSLKSRWSYRHLLPPASEVCGGYVYTSVRLSTGRVSATHTTPPEQIPPSLPSAGWDTHPLPSECWDTVNKRAVCIPLECILVLHCKRPDGTIWAVLSNFSKIWVVARTAVCMKAWPLETCTAGTSFITMCSTQTKVFLPRLRLELLSYYSDLYLYWSFVTCPDWLKYWCKQASTLKDSHCYNLLV